MSILESATAAQEKTPLIMTICGDAGSGKTSLAATFPAPFIIRTQGEAVPRDVDPVPGLPAIGGKMVEMNGKKVWDEGELFDQLKALLRDPHNYETLIIDSVTGLEDLFVHAVVEQDPKNPKSVVQAAGGYGAGRAAVKAKHNRVKKAAEMLRDKRGMNVVFIAHVEIDRMDPPDGDAYSRYNLQLHKESAPVYVNNVDVVGFLKQERFVDEEQKARTSDGRILSVAMTPANVSKNRLGIDRDLTVTKGENPFKEYI